MRAILDRLARAGRWFTSGPASAGPFFYPEWMSCRLTAEVARDKRLRSPLVAARSPKILPPFRRRGPHFKSCPHSVIAEGRSSVSDAISTYRSIDRKQVVISCPQGNAVAVLSAGASLCPHSRAEVGDGQSRHRLPRTHLHSRRPGIEHSGAPTGSRAGTTAGAGNRSWPLEPLTFPIPRWNKETSRVLL